MNNNLKLIVDNTEENECDFEVGNNINPCRKCSNLNECLITKTVKEIERISDEFENPNNKHTLSKFCAEIQKVLNNAKHLSEKIKRGK